MITQCSLSGFDLNYYLYEVYPILFVDFFIGRFMGFSPFL